MFTAGSSQVYVAADAHFWIKIYMLKSNTLFTPCSHNMSPSDSWDEQALLARFGPLLSISDESIVSLASAIRHRISGRIPSPNGHLATRLNGGYNLIYIVQFDDEVKHVIRVPAVGWGSRWTEYASDAFKSQGLTMRFIKEHTTFPVPEIYDFDTSQRNIIGAPYMVMNFIPGHTMMSTWFDKDRPTSLEERRLRILASVAKRRLNCRSLASTR